MLHALLVKHVEASWELHLVCQFVLGDWTKPNERRTARRILTHVDIGRNGGIDAPVQVIS